VFLATTPLSIRDEQDIVLLGPWCLEGRGELDLGANRLIDHRLVHAENKLLMNKEVRETVERLLTHLGKRLNALHGQSHSDRYWRIICGRWLLGFADVLYQRWNLIDNALTQFPIDCAGGSALDHSTIAPRRSQDFAHQRISHDWNTQVFTSILEYRKVAIDLFPRERITGGAPVAAKSRLIKTVALSMWGLMARRSPVCIADSYLETRSELALALSNRSLPVRLTRVIPSTAKYSESKREALRLSLAYGSSFEEFLFDNIHRWLPYSWVEDFSDLSEGPHTRQLPRNPRTIFTANAHYSSDYFMIYMASQAERGSRIVLSQHGGLYGEGEVRSRNEEHELAIADTYVTWGWKDSKYNNIVNGPNQISRLTSTKCTSREGGLLIVLDTTFRYSRYSWETRPERDLYLESCAVLHSALPSAIQKKSVIRLHHDHNRYDEGHEKFFKESQEVAFDDFSRPIEKSIAVSRLVIVTTLSTTFIENVSRGIPTLIYAQPEIYEVRAEYREIFDELARVGVLHDSPVSAARWATSIWDGVEHWWNSEPVQVAVSLYGRHFAGFPSEERRTWQQILGGSSLKS
jgi:putative transferase (TIGR04331 family)